MGTSSKKIAVIAAISTIWPTFALPQTTGASQGGLQVDLGVSTSLEVDDNFNLTPGNPSGSSTIFDTDFVLGVSSVTAAQSLLFVGTGVLRFAEIPGRSISGFEDPNVRLNYVANNSNSRFAVDGRYRYVDREFLNPFQIERDEQQSTDLEQDGGTLIYERLGLTYETGLTGPLGFYVSLFHDDRSYKNTTDPDLFDNANDSVDATVTMRLSPVTSLNLNGGLAYYTADDLVSTDRTTTDVSVGVSHELDGVNVIDARLGYTDVETDTIFGTAPQSGTTGGVDWVRTLSNGTVFASFDASVNQNGMRTTVDVGRDMQTLNGILSGTLGASRSDNGDVFPVATLSYTRQMRSSDISVDLYQQVYTDNNNDDVLDTRLSIAYGYDLDALSRIDLSLDYGQTMDGGVGNAPTTARTDLSASYSRAVTSDWDLTGGVLLRHQTETGVADAQSNSLFVTLDRRFSFRP